MMDGRGGCCIARYATDLSKVDRIMLRFRPIAPKPVAGGTNSAGSSSESGGGDAISKKRKCAKSDNNNSKRCNNNYKKRRKSSPEKEDAVVTLPLLPEAPARGPTWLSFENYDQCPPAVVGSRGSLVRVETVTEAWVEGDALGSTDQERRWNLSRDTCPGFISDGYGRVTWTNGAYRRMVGEASEKQEGVWLVMKENIGKMMSCGSFTCRVRVEYYNNNNNNSTCGTGNNNKRNSLTLPCDVWRMDNGGFAWRLDLNAALTLSLLS